MDGQFEKLAYEAALRSLDKQEAYVEELRARAGVLLAASSLAPSLLGHQVFQVQSRPGLVIAALLAFVISIGAGVFILLPKQSLVFVQVGVEIYEAFYGVSDDMPEVYRRLTYDLDRFWRSNDAKVKWLVRVFALAAVALIVEVLVLVALLWDNLLSA
ncbi:MAG TPA: hypothetical protein VFY75_04835 [Solirubrobacterales bacterium]|nr:hypothetical protein [Solirubrobacterales bacterium]